MLTLKYLDSDTCYDISFKKVSASVVQITGTFDAITSGFYILKGDTVIGNYLDYKSIYRIIDNGVQFSNDGSIYQEPEPAQITPPSLEDIKLSKKQEISTSCKQAIYDGIAVTFDNGNTEHFSLTIEDQINLISAKEKLDSGITQIELHHDGGLFRYYTVDELSKILEEKTLHIDYHRAYCNSLNVWINDCTSIEEVQNIVYGVEVPEKYRSVVLNNYLTKIANSKE